MEKKFGLAHARWLYEHQEECARELKARGHRIMGYLCSFIPLEMLTAAGFIPFRIMGDLKQPLSNVSSYCEGNICPYMLNRFERAIRGHYDFLDAVVMPHGCDAVERVYGLWRYYIKGPLYYYLNIPCTVGLDAIVFLKEELLRFKEWLEKHTNAVISEKKLRDVIALYNENRRLVRELYEMRKHIPPLLSGSEMIQTIISGLIIPPDEFQRLLQSIIKEVRIPRHNLEEKKVRILVWGCSIDSVDFIRLVEECGADVVVEDTCVGVKRFCIDVGNTKDPLEDLIETYFTKFTCPRIFTGTGIERFGYIIDYLRDFSVNGVIMYTYRYCDVFNFDVPDLSDYLESARIPTLRLQDDYTLSNLGGVKTRIQAFVELISWEF